MVHITQYWSGPDRFRNHFFSHRVFLYIHAPLQKAERHGIFIERF